MKLFTTALALAIVFAQPTFAADVLTVVNGTQTCDGIPIASTATLNLTQKQVPLTTVGFGLRTKKVVIANVQVYCATFLVSEPSAFTRSATDDAALKSTDGMNAVAFKLDFVRNVDAGTVSQSFAEALRANGVDLNGTNVAAFLNAVKNGGDAQSGHSLTIAGDEKTGEVLYQSTNGSIQAVQGDSKLVHDIVSIWLGNPADSGLAKLKPQLIGN